MLFAMEKVQQINLISLRHILWHSTVTDVVIRCKRLQQYEVFLTIDDKHTYQLTSIHKKSVRVWANLDRVVKNLQKEIPYSNRYTLLFGDDDDKS